MNSDIVKGKLLEYTGKACVAEAMGRGDAARDATRMVLLMLRLQSRGAYTRLRAASNQRCSAARSVKLAERAGVSFPLGQQWVERYRTGSAAALKALVKVGEEMCAALDLWQRQGATLHDLCNLCNRDDTQVLEEIGEDSRDEWFSKLVFVHNLDYKDLRNRGFIGHDVDAPLTHAVKEYMLDIMLHTPEGRKASHEAMEAVFPEIMESAMRLVTDADGVQHLIDKDGVEVGTVGEED